MAINFAEAMRWALILYLILDISVTVCALALGEWAYFVAFLGFGMTTLGLILEAWKWL